MLESFGSLPYGNVAPAPVITRPASFALATIALAHPSMDSKEMKYPPRGAIQEPISSPVSYTHLEVYKRQFLNSVLGQKDCLKSTDGYNYLAMDDDVWMYTGVTSVNGDQSNVGFVLANQRTMETRYYEVEGATEAAAMESAEGQVQNLKYTATFPLLLNLQGEPTYFIALKDDAGLVKKYALVNVQKYQIVAIGDTVSQCEDNYLDLLYTNGVKETEKDTREVKTITGKITKIAQAVVDGNSHYYLMLEGSDEIFDVSVADYINVIRYDVGQEVNLEYKEGDLSLIHILAQKTKKD